MYRMVQLGVPPSLSIWAQRAGRAGRDKTINAEAYIVAKVSMLKTRKPTAKELSKAASAKQQNLEREQDDEEPNDGEIVDNNVGDVDEEQAEVEDENGQLVYVKKVDPDVRKWIECEECKREFFAVYFDYRKPEGMFNSFCINNY